MNDNQRLPTTTTTTMLQPTRHIQEASLEDARGNRGVYQGPVLDAPPGEGGDEEQRCVPHGNFGQMVYQNHPTFVKYSGDWANGFWVRGTLLYTNGNVYSGEWNSTGQPHGEGTLEWTLRRPNGPASNDGGRAGSIEDSRVYKGQWYNGKRHGRGVYEWVRTGAVYDGEFYNGERHGFGKFHDPLTQIEYSGEWQHNSYHGFGQYVWHDKQRKRHVYKGAFASGKPHGQGIQVNFDGSVHHEGEWREGKPVRLPTATGAASPTPRVVPRGTGGVVSSSPNKIVTRTVTRVPPPTTSPAGTSRSNSGRVYAASSGATNSVTVVQDREWLDTVNQNVPTMGIYRGLWLNNNPYQNGFVEYQTGEVLTFDGWFNRQGYYHGQSCRLTFLNGDSFEGDFCQGQRHGKGVYKWKDGRQYHGSFVQNQRHGFGTLTYPNSDFFEGSFENGQRHGHGRFVFSNGSMYEGSWKRGLYHGTGTLVQPDGSTYIGTFFQGVKHGEGKEIDPMGKIVFEGEFDRGQRHDKESEPFLAEESNPTPSEEKKVGTASPPRTKGPVQLEPVPTLESHRSNSMRMTGLPSAPPPASAPPAVPTYADSLRSPMAPPPVAPPPIAPAPPPYHDQGSFILGENDDDGVLPWNAEGADAVNQFSLPRERDRSDELPCEAVVDQEITDCQGNPGRFTGIVLVSTKRPHGVGRLVYADGKRIHEGFWKHGSKEGHGRCLFFPQGDFHEGEYQNNLRNGPGRYQWKDGRLFVGHYKDDLRHGKGVFTYPSGDRYEGMFQHGQRSGFGVFEFSGGSYRGGWRNGKYHGDGTLLWGRGSEYKGEFVSGVFEGEGTMTDAFGKIVQQGRWYQGKPVKPRVQPSQYIRRSAPETVPVTDDSHHGSMILRATDARSATVSIDAEKLENQTNLAPLPNSIAPAGDDEEERVPTSAEAPQETDHDEKSDLVEIAIEDDADAPPETVVMT